MRFTCTCGENIFYPSAYEPKTGETEPCICPRCRKKWSLYGGRGGTVVEEPVEEDDQ